MKRQNNLFENIIDYNNIRLAFLKALRGNRNSPAAINYCQNVDKNLAILQNKLSSLKPDWGGYISFQIFDPKLRTISTAPFEQRIMHHAIMNIIELILERQMIFHSYACRKGKGTHAAVIYAFNQCKVSPYFLKLDIRKYFDSINHGILKSKLDRLLKDSRAITLLNGIIDSYNTQEGKGVPIGNLTSQFFANMYLAGMDHYILEKLKPSAYCRYMDDFVIWANSLKQLKEINGKINEYVNNSLNLNVKPAVFGKTDYGLPFLGFLIKKNGIYLMQKSKRRVKERILEISSLLHKDIITEEKASQRVQSVFAAITLARTNTFRKKLCKKGEQLQTKNLLALTV